MKSVATFAILAVSAAAMAQQAAPPTRMAGTVTAVASDGLTLKDAAGNDVKLGLAPNVVVLAARPIAREDIKPGDFVASANLSETDGIGRSIEMRVFEPGSRAGEGNRPMTQPGAAANQMMTNATVTKVVRTGKGLELDVQYPGGVRHLIVPPEVTIVGSYPVEASQLKPGVPVTVNAIAGADGALRATRIQIAAGTPPR